nr:Uncharacterized protein A9P81_2472 [Leptospira interrogans serovar Copenhageni/Icterohaemorrhagiae]
MCCIGLPMKTFLECLQFQLHFLIFWKLEDDSVADLLYWIITGSIFLIFLFKLAFVSSILPYEIWK